MTGDQKRMGAAVAASALINLLFLISIFLAPDGTPVEAPGINRTSPLRVGLLPSVDREVQPPEESHKAPESASPPVKDVKPVEAQREVKSPERDAAPQKSAEPEEPRSVSRKEGETDSLGDGESLSGSTPSLAQGEAGSEASEESLQDLRSRFLVYLQNEIAARQEYPFRARRRGTEGIVVLSLQVLADGSLRSYRIEQSSGSSSLDRAAEKLLTSIFPSSRIPGKDISCTVAVEYRLN